jgi:hypothetical protein
MSLRPKDEAAARRSPAGRMYPHLKTKPEPDPPKRPPIDGWAKQRQAWGEHDQRARGFMSPLGGKAKGKTENRS